MCGRFAFAPKPNEVEKLVSGIKINQAIKPRYNIAPSQNLPAVLNDGNTELSYIRWGLIPFWAESAAVGFKMINARAETLADKPSFKNSLKRRRCIILSSGFYEWKKGNGRNTATPYFIKMKNDSLFAFAGLWDHWEDKAEIDENKKKIISATIVTTTPNDTIKDIHDRMPVILNNEDIQTWLNPSGDLPITSLLNCLKTYDANLMTAYEISQKVNNPENDDNSIIAALDTSSKEANSLF